MSKRVTLLLIIVLAMSSLIVVKAVPASASIPKPSIPEFTVELVAHPYDVPPTYEIDPYTGESIMPQDGYHVENRSIEITIRNQPFTKYKLDNGQYADFFYNISYKGHYEKDWKYYSYDQNTNWFSRQSDSEYTVISFNKIPTEGLMDFRVQAQIGYYTEYQIPFTVYNFTGETSGWSSTQTLTISESQAASTSILEIVVRAVVLLVISLVVIGVLVYFKKRKHAPKSGEVNI